MTKKTENPDILLRLDVWKTLSAYLKKEEREFGDDSEKYDYFYDAVDKMKKYIGGLK